MGTDRHRDICAMQVGDHLIPMINAEVTAKREALLELDAHFTTERTRLREAPGRPLVVDTNILLQHLPPWQIDWSKVIDEKARLIIPLRVIEEIDAKKYGGNERLQRIARSLLPQINERLGDNGSGPVQLEGSTATIELHIPSSPRVKPDDADEEILDVVDHIGHFISGAAILTDDTGMLLRARSGGLNTVDLKGRFLRSKDGVMS